MFVTLTVPRLPWAVATMCVNRNFGARAETTLQNKQDGANFAGVPVCCPHFLTLLTIKTPLARNNSDAPRGRLDSASIPPVCMSRRRDL